MNDTIYRFDGDYDFLSNFYILRSPIVHNGLSFPTSEHAYQAAKFLDHDRRLQIAKASTPYKSKTLGRQLGMRPDFDKIKDHIMLEILRLKFQDQYLKIKLLATENRNLVEGNYWHDNYWGNCYCMRTQCLNVPSHNKLGLTLVKVRKELS